MLSIKAHLLRTKASLERGYEQAFRVQGHFTVKEEDAVWFEQEMQKVTESFVLI